MTFDPSMIGRRATTCHGETGTVVGAAKDPARCTFRPDAGRDSIGPCETCTPQVRHLTFDAPKLDGIGRQHSGFVPSDHVAREFIPDVLYAVSARVMRHRHVMYEGMDTGSSEHWAVNLPTFYLDSRVQGIVSEDHAERIVRGMLADLGHAAEDIYVQACATLAPIHDRKG